MSKKMLIDARHREETRVAVLSGGVVEDFDFESLARKPLRGNIYLAKITRVEPSLQAAFVEYGGNRHGFLAFGEIHPDYYQIPVSDREILREAEALEAELAAKLAELDKDIGPSEDDDDDHDTSSTASANDDGETDAKDDAESAPAPRARRRRGGRRRGRKDASSETSQDQTDEAKAEGDASASADGDAPATDTSEEASAPEAVTTSDSATDGVADDAPTTDDAPAEASAETSPEASPDTSTDTDDPDDDGTPPAPRTIALEDQEPPSVRQDPEEPIADEPEATSSDADSHQDTAEEIADEAAAAVAELEASDEAAEASDDADASAAEDNAEATDAADGESPEQQPEEPSTPDVDPSVTAEAEAIADLERRYAEARRARDRLLKNYRIQEVIKRRQIILIQVVKEERGNKGAALTTFLSLAGRYGVLMPNNSRGGGVSRKITNQNDRKRLRRAISELDVPNGQGLIIRTAGAKRTKAEIKRDYDYLARLWDVIREQTMTSVAPCQIYEEASLIKRAIRDLYDKDTSEVLVEGEEGYREAKDFMKMLMPSHAKNVQRYKDRQPLFLRHDVERQLDQMYQPTVQLKSGGYLVIQQTEALISIDVNSGKATKERNVEATALKTNSEAAVEVARQCRLRDLAGLVVIDFIDMEENRNNRAVEKKLKDALKVDRARIQTGSISSFGLLEMSRQRRRSGIVDGTTRLCPTCDGAGAVRSVEMAALRILRGIEDVAVKDRPGVISATTNTDVALYILNQKRSWLNEIETVNQLTIEILSDAHKTGDQYTIEKKGKAAEIESLRQAPGLDITNLDSAAADKADTADTAPSSPEAANDTADSDDEDGGTKRRRKRRRRRKSGSEEAATEENQDASADTPAEDAAQSEGDAEDTQSREAGSAEEDPEAPRKRRRRGRRGGKRSRADGAETQEGAEALDAPEVSEVTPASEAGDTAPASPEAAPEPAAESAPDTDAIASNDAVANDDAVAPSTPASAPPAEPKAAPATSASRKASLHDPVEPTEKTPKQKRGGWWQRAFGGE